MPDICPKMYHLFEVEVFIYKIGWVKELHIYHKNVELKDNKTRKNCRLVGTSNEFPVFPCITNEGNLIEDVYFKREEEE